MLNDLSRAIVMKGVRWAGVAAGSSVAAWVFSNSAVISGLNEACKSLSTPEALSTAVGGGAVALASLYFSIRDAKVVDAKLTTVAATGSLAAANAPEVREAVVEAVRTGQIPSSVTQERTPGQQAAHARLNTP